MKTDYINNYIEKNISEKRKRHIYAVKDTALKLASLYGADLEKVETAVLFHDMFKELSGQEMNQYIKHFNLDSKYLNNSNLAHSKIAAAVMAKDYEITDEDILNAVSYHTTGRPNMSKLEKIIYLADAIEPNREYPGVEELRKAAFVNLDDACILSLTRTIDYVQSQNSILDEDTIKARDYLKEMKRLKEIVDEQ
ncbi:bis(5'-nucleosyl)-tetraphosphatase (symmetrical) YqeK [Aminipila terrae]|uniref:bis(5'-nucleosyl)-tetraphosphatase (symmetrical) n=1 Tax=Aminipila terrae TaxID=2697030 RepID=A0A6P1MG59_9FIRM|nr:bis(5'-nucleosyl)-tetraphosphatase (symmetrical) YqeK [Aminipila terrae]QHI73689.1 HD domain-containing protein [Aminipila terrae]